MNKKNISLFNIFILSVVSILTIFGLNFSSISFDDKNINQSKMPQTNLKLPNFEVTQIGATENSISINVISNGLPYDTGNINLFSVEDSSKSFGPAFLDPNQQNQSFIFSDNTWIPGQSFYLEISGLYSLGNSQDAFVYTHDEIFQTTPNNLVNHLDINTSLEDINVYPPFDFNQTENTNFLIPDFSIYGGKESVAVTSNTADFGLVSTPGSFVNAQVQYSIKNNSLWNFIGPENVIGQRNLNFIHFYNLEALTSYDVRIISYNSESSKIFYVTQYFQDLFTTEQLIIPSDAVISNIQFTPFPRRVAITYNYNRGTNGNGRVRYRIVGPNKFGQWIDLPISESTGAKNFIVLDLLPNSQYSVYINAIDSNSLASFTFQTTASNEPVVSNVEIVKSSITKYSAVVSFDYDKSNGNGTIIYLLNGVSNFLGDDFQDGNHSFELTDLKPGETYEIYVRPFELVADYENGSFDTFQTLSPTPNIIDIEYELILNVGLLIKTTTLDIFNNLILNVYGSETSTTSITTSISVSQSGIDTYQFTLIGLDLSISYWLEFSQAGFKSSSRFKTPIFENNEDFIFVDSFNISNISSDGKIIQSSFNAFLPIESSNQTYKAILYDQNHNIQQELIGNIKSSNLKEMSSTTLEFNNFSELANNEWYVVLEITFISGGMQYRTTPIFSQPLQSQESLGSSLLWLWILLGIVGIVLVIGLIIWYYKKPKSLEPTI